LSANRKRGIRWNKTRLAIHVDISSAAYPFHDRRPEALFEVFGTIDSLGLSWFLTSVTRGPPETPFSAAIESWRETPPLWQMVKVAGNSAKCTARGKIASLEGGHAATRLSYAIRAEPD
jgi:hypothetical protein